MAGSLPTLLNGGVVEVKFQRRRPVTGKPISRRMLCTSSNKLLNSLKGQAVFKFKSPIQAPKYNPSSHNLIITYDLFKLDFRAIPLNASVLSVIPTSTDEQIDEFWKYFNENIYNLSSEQKESFINS